MRNSRLADMASSTQVTLSTLATVDEGQEGLQRMNIIIKADATGTVEAVKGALMNLPQDTVALRFLLASTGSVNASDVDLAKTTGAFVVAFNVPVSEEAEALAKMKGVDLKQLNIIYNVLDEVRARMEGKIKKIMEKVRV